MQCLGGNIPLCEYASDIVCDDVCGQEADLILRVDCDAVIDHKC